jgi:enamine deaminase RidA (YjgF/YER057c/UK114 family)
MSTTEARLTELGITLPGVTTPVANYVPFVISGKLVFCSGQICFNADGKLNPKHVGKLGAEVSADDAKAAARLCGLNLLALAKAAAGGDLDKIARCVRLGGFINAVPTYAGLPAIMNGASDLMVEVLGDRGRHARSTIGVAELPADAVVEVEAVFELV